MPVATLCLALLLSACAESPQPQAAVRDVGAQEAADLLAEGGVTVLDIRTPREFGQGHIAGAENIDFQSPDFKQALQGLDRARPYLVHCASGGRSTRSLAVFAELGFEKVYHLRAGMRGWRAAGQPVESE